MLYLSKVPFEELGFKVAVRDDAYPELTWAALSKVPHVLGVGAAFLFGVSWVINRRIQLGVGENDEQSEAPRRVETPNSKSRGDLG